MTRKKRNRKRAKTKGIGIGISPQQKKQKLAESCKYCQTSLTKKNTTVVSNDYCQTCLRSSASGFINDNIHSFDIFIDTEELAKFHDPKFEYSSKYTLRRTELMNDFKSLGVSEYQAKGIFQYLNNPDDKRTTAFKNYLEIIGIEEDSTEEEIEKTVELELTELYSTMKAKEIDRLTKHSDYAEMEVWFDEDYIA